MNLHKLVTCLVLVALFGLVVMPASAAPEDPRMDPNGVHATGEAGPQMDPDG